MQTALSNEDYAWDLAADEIEQEKEMVEAWWGEGIQGWDWDDWDTTEGELAEWNQRKEDWDGYFGTELELLGEWLADKYPWENVGDVVVFLISGRPPRLAQPLSATHDTGNATFSLNFSPWVSEKTVRDAYRYIQYSQGRIPGDKTIRVLRFVAEQTNEKGVPPSWAALWERWNAANPNDRYENRSALYKAYRRAVEALVPPYLPLTDNAETWGQRFVPLLTDSAATVQQPERIR